jgi:hypothetical protein
MDKRLSWSLQRLDAELALDGGSIVRVDPDAQKPADCCCENKGRPFLLAGVLVTSWNVGCHVHRPLSPRYEALDRFRRAY